MTTFTSDNWTDFAVIFFYCSSELAKFYEMRLSKPDGMLLPGVMSSMPIECYGIGSKFPQIKYSNPTIVPLEWYKDFYSIKDNSRYSRDKLWQSLSVDLSKSSFLENMNKPILKGGETITIFKANNKGAPSPVHVLDFQETITNITLSKEH